MRYQISFTFYQSTSYRKIKNFRIFLNTEEIEGRRKYLIKQAQRQVEFSEKFINNEKRFNLHKKQEEIYEFRGRTEGAHPVCTLSDSVLRRKLYSPLIIIIHCMWQ